MHPPHGLHRRLAPVVVAIAGLIVAGTATPAAAAPAPMVPLAGPAPAAGPASLADAADQLSSGLDPSTYGGIYVDTATNSVTLMALKGRTPAAALNRAASPATGVAARTRYVTRSMATLTDMRDTSIWTRLPKDLRSHITGTQIDVLGNRVVINMDTVTDAARTELYTAFGDSVAVRQADAPSLMSGRYADTAPFYFGDRLIFSFPGGDIYGACTGGFGATYQGDNVMVSAGHCAPYGYIGTIPTVVNNGSFYGEAGCTNVNWCKGVSIGTVWQTRFKDYATSAQAQAGALSIDLSLTHANTLPYTFAAGSNSTVTLLHSYPGPARNPSGTVCFSGATSLGYCGFVVQAQPTTVIGYDGVGYAKITVWHATANSSAIKVCEGDSGGTVYTHISGGGESILGVVSTGWGADRPSVNGASCSANLGFTFWGQGTSTFPGYLPVIG